MFFAQMGLPHKSILYIENGMKTICSGSTLDLFDSRYKSLKCLSSNGYLMIFTDQTEACFKCPVRFAAV